jgi:hypothetical protein
MSFQWSQTDRTAGEGFLRIARDQIAKAIATAGDDGKSTEKRVHEVRRRCKRLRALLRLVRHDFPEYAAVNALLRDAARGLSGSRDQWVALETYAELMEWAGRPIPKPEMQAVDSEAEAEALATFGAHLQGLLASTSAWSLRRIDLRTLTKGLKRTYKQARWMRRFAERRRTAEAFHEWRKYAKYHWNQLVLLEDCAGDVLPSLRKGAGDLAVVLGQHHDLSVLESIHGRSPQEIGTDIDVGFATEAIARRRAELENRISVLGQQVFADTPRALTTA